LLHTIIGIIAIVVGLRGIVANWYMFLDILGATVPLALIGFGVVALLAGIRHVKRT
jgi:hypothetical protein